MWLLVAINLWINRMCFWCSRGQVIGWANYVRMYPTLPLLLLYVSNLKVLLYVLNFPKLAIVCTRWPDFWTTWLPYRMPRHQKGCHVIGLHVKRGNMHTVKIIGKFNTYSRTFFSLMHKIAKLIKLDTFDVICPK